MFFELIEHHFAANFVFGVFIKVILMRSNRCNTKYIVHGGDAQIKSVRLNGINFGNIKIQYV